MSESDDTDELLLMPSQVDDRHILEDNFVPYYQIVDKLITQVSKLKSRITSIENSSDVSLGSATNSIDTFLNMRSSDSSNTCRRCYSYESLPQHSEHRRSTLPCFSTQSTPQKPRSKLMLKSFPNSPKYEDDLKQFKRPLHRAGVPRAKIEDNDRVNGNGGIHKPPLTEESNIIKEIDNFLSSVKPSAKLEAARTLDFHTYNHEYSEKPSKTALDVQQILREMDEQEVKIKNMYEYSTETNTENQIQDNKETKNPIDWKVIDTLSMTSTDSSLTDKSTVLYRPIIKKSETERETVKDKIVEIDDRKNLTNQGLKGNTRDEAQQKGSTIIRTPNPSTFDIGTNITENFSSISTFTKKSISSPQCDIHSNAKDVLTMHKKLLDETHSPEFNRYSDPSEKLPKPASNPNLGSVSLINLWSMGNKEPEKSADKCIQKLQEEKMRRTHCEELIQQLQNKILEQQEKLAVAIQVDEAKDTAIIKFHDAWERANMKFRLVVKERDQLEKEVANLSSQNKKMSEEWEERIEFHRKESNQALNMSRDHQNKLEVVEKKFKELISENEALKLSTQELENQLRSGEEKNKQLSNILANKEIELSESKNILLHAKQEVAQCQAAVEMCQKDFATIKAEYDLIQEEIRTERLNVSQLHDQNKALHDELETQRKTEKSLVDNLKEAQEKLESNKMELRNFYQGQVELLVQTKLKEFQKQLDEAEHKMKEELAKKELEIAKSAAIHIQQITDKYSLEINLLEQKHREEMQLKEVKTAQLEQRLHDLQVKFERQHEKRADLMKQLQKVMEAQWTEALRIINNGKSPTSPDDSTSTIDQLHSLHSKSYQNMEALLTQDFEEKMRNQHHGHSGKEAGHYNVQSEKRGHQKQNESFGHRSSRNKNTKTQDEGSLQRYINLLLHKQPGHPVESKEKSSSPKYFTEHPTTDRSAWQHPDSSQCIKSDFQENDSHKDGSKRKTPWK